MRRESKRVPDALSVLSCGGLGISHVDEPTGYDDADSGGGESGAS